MTPIEKRLRRNFTLACVLHAALIVGIVLFEGVLANARNDTPPFVELIVPADILGELPKGPGQGRGDYAPPAQSSRAETTFSPGEALYTPEQRPAPQPKSAPQSPASPEEILIPKKSEPKPQKRPATATSAKKPATAAKPAAKPTAKPATAKAGTATASTGHTAASADAIRARFAKALQSSGDGAGGTPYGDGRPAGGGTASEGRIGSPDGAIDGIAGGIGKGSPFWSYYLHVHDRMYEAWEQPGQAAGWDSRLVTTLVIRVARDGRIADVRMLRSSGNRLMDDSVLAAARSVPRLQPLPEGLGNEFADITVNFRLEG